MKKYKRYLPILILLILALLFYLTGLNKYFTFKMLRQEQMNLLAFEATHPFLCPVLFMLVYFLTTALSLPLTLLLDLVAGLLFPQPYSTLIVVVSATLGASVVFIAAQGALGDFLWERAGKRLKRLEKGFRENAVSYLLFLRLVVLFPFFIINVAPAFFKVRFRTFLWTTFVGVIPAAFVFTQAGVGLSAILQTPGEINAHTFFNNQMIIAFCALAIFSLLPILIKKWMKNGR